MIINATNINKYPSGLGRYSLNLVRSLLEYKEQLETERSEEIKIIVNKNAQRHFSLHEQRNLIFVTPSISPDYCFIGHIKRLLYTHHLSLKTSSNEWIFNLSQLEISLCRKKQIIVVHDLIPLLFPKLHPKLYYFFRFVLPISLRNATWVLTVSEHSKKLLQTHYHLPADKIKVFPNFFTMPRPSPTALTSKREDFIFFLGRPAITKNIPRLVLSYGMLRRRYQNLKTKLVLGGVLKCDFQWDDVCLSVLNEFKQDITFKGRIPEQDLSKLFISARLFFFPSLYEGFGLPPLEALIHGCPILVANTSSLPEIYENSALYCDPYDLEDITNKLYSMLTNHELVTSLLNNSIKIIEKFQKDKVFKKYYDFLCILPKHKSIASPRDNHLEKIRVLQSK